jgi:hypothetical protein
MTVVADRARGDPLAQHLASRPHRCRSGPVPSTNQPFNSASPSEIAMNRIHLIRRRMRWAARSGPDQGDMHDERG